MAILAELSCAVRRKLSTSMCRAAIVSLGVWGDVKDHTGAFQGPDKQCQELDIGVLMGRTVLLLCC